MTDLRWRLPVGEAGSPALRSYHMGQPDMEQPELEQPDGDKPDTEQPVDYDIFVAGEPQRAPSGAMVAFMFVQTKAGQTPEPNFMFDMSTYRLYGLKMNGESANDFDAIAFHSLTALVGQALAKRYPDSFAEAHGEDWETFVETEHERLMNMTLS